ncbi:MAG: hypothetical protein HKO89_06585 [Saprospiraceae bacterium]|nr:hypothetical protein [Saprospiraceae bacterium]
MEKKAGVWIDKKKAQLVTFSGENVNIKILESGIETFHPKGGTRSKDVFGPVITVKEKTYLEKEKRQHKKFFEEIFTAIKSMDYLVIMGPALMKKELAKFIDNVNGPKPELLDVQSADSMTENQIVAEIKKAFRHF